MDTSIVSKIVLKILPDGLNHEQGRSGEIPHGIVFHITKSDSIAPVDGWFANPQARVSAHVAIDRDGTIHQYVNSHNTAWSNGGINNPAGYGIDWIRECVDKGINPNHRTLSIEHVGYGTYDSGNLGRIPAGITPQQFESSVALATYWCQIYNLSPDKDHLVGHNYFDTVTRPICPGPIFPLAEIRQEVARRVVLGKGQ